MQRRTFADRKSGFLETLLCFSIAWMEKRGNAFLFPILEAKTYKREGMVTNET